MEALITGIALDTPTVTALCRSDPTFFLMRFCQIYDATTGAWIPFDLWPAQREALGFIHLQRLVVILKARQLGLSWLVLAFGLWLMIFHPAATVLIFSDREDDAKYLLERLRAMYRRLPAWLHLLAGGVVTDSATSIALANGSMVKAFPATAGDGYTATLAIVDEADLSPNLARLLGAAKPTIDGGGRMVLLSRADKDNPQGPFKNIYRAARAGDSPWKPLFLPWHVRPGRDQAWYDEQRAAAKSHAGSEDGADDYMSEHYPGDDAEALSEKTFSKRLAPAWLKECWREQMPLAALDWPGVPTVAALKVFRPPQPGHQYVIGADPAEGNPTSDDSALEVLDVTTGEEVAALAGKFEPSIFGGYIAQVGRWYNNASVMVERQNHGHAVLLWLAMHGSFLPRLLGHDGKEGWNSSSLGKVLLYDACADALRNTEVTIHSFATYTQLASIDGTTLRAPDGQHDDVADAFALACVGRPKIRGIVWATSLRRIRGTNAAEQMPHGVWA